MYRGAGAATRESRLIARGRTTGSKWYCKSPETYTYTILEHRGHQNSGTSALVRYDATACALLKRMELTGRKVLIQQADTRQRINLLHRISMRKRKINNATFRINNFWIIGYNLPYISKSAPNLDPTGSYERKWTMVYHGSANSRQHCTAQYTHG
ncbi:hypothetical protein K503DRAFT_781546 [Rhizopogon vinicolor AM-OR11-026]|uniref:Uncharacterized protein n=1 Tax=Rhizopogon vinicolor AM-OR11-026 TaxID=1314800 RepID=A0A1B7N5Z8_9AGAM|nr:hypothetical protein K503DRAFT_781546 [Rhizopogon vinicolor AM-OR11-026]